MPAQHLPTSPDIPTIKQWLPTVPLLADLPLDLIDTLAKVLKPKRFVKEQVLIKKGTPPDGLYIVWEGEMGVYDGDLRFATIHPKEVVGEQALLVPQKRTATVIAESDVLVLWLQRKQFFNLLGTEPEVMSAMVHLLVERNGEKQETMLSGFKTREEALIKANAELDQFLYHASHSLRRPLTTFKGLLQLMRYTPEGPAAEEVMTEMQTNVTHMDAMLRKLIEASELKLPENKAQEEILLKDFLEQEAEKYIKHYPLTYKIAIAQPVRLHLPPHWLHTLFREFA